MPFFYSGLGCGVRGSRPPDHPLVEVALDPLPDEALRLARVRERILSPGGLLHTREAGINTLNGASLRLSNGIRHIG